VRSESGRRLGVAARVAAIDAEYRAAVEQAEADCETIVKAWDDPYTTLPLVYGTTGLVLPPPDEAIAQRDRVIREADERRRVALDALDLEETNSPSLERLSKREPFPVRQLTDAVRLLVVDGASLRAVAAETKLTTRRVDYIRTALAWGDLTWDERHGCLGSLPGQWNTRDGIRLPVRPNTRPPAGSL
jgi:hypothetical protein